ncbi:uncharacterized protein TRIVIDRAFT_60573 [Trichoderma virens Gv29-8]|uniref:Uncharacterized protein n=1 Tax=Hypocrea virens (strain Gv29-8 / FGSC 10586) TaxID=413071 RepID=G9MR51_HYPVG|nr:uncharacterized protein TRIVIDRAFT_60573 [Trichoderma virens Gv29-8]EHK23204.1 hypothetical protein TRIVIDRAFT_60573 [Trichoderma virens Gv29-8]UKZ47623.1 hypothetical protein TrVGV298_001846 [Trichoderma virens]
MRARYKQFEHMFMLGVCAYWALSLGRTGRQPTSWICSILVPGRQGVYRMIRLVAFGLRSFVVLGAFTKFIPPLCGPEIGGQGNGQSASPVTSIERLLQNSQSTEYMYMYLPGLLPTTGRAQVHAISANIVWHSFSLLLTAQRAGTCQTPAAPMPGLCQYEYGHPLSSAITPEANSLPAPRRHRGGS